MLVMKFGGTSVGCAESITRVCGIVRERLLLRPVVVVSALARVTDELQSMGVLSRDGRLEDAVSLLRAIEARHAGMARALFPGSSREFVEERLRPAFQEAHDLLKAIAAIQELTPRTLDRLLGFGERWSSALVAETFRAHGLAAVLVDAGAVIVTDANHSHATALMDLIKLRVASTVRPLLESGSIPVLGGFIGATTDGVPTTLGRGGSDFTASILGASLEAESIEIWTDVDGMMTADPRICPDAQNIDSISFEEAAELAHFGAKVLHPKTLQPAVERGIPVYVLNSRQPKNCGTRVETTNGHFEARRTAIPETKLPKKSSRRRAKHTASSQTRTNARNMTVLVTPASAVVAALMLPRFRTSERFSGISSDSAMLLAEDDGAVAHSAAPTCAPTSPSS
jgi:aspartate kinase